VEEGLFPDDVFYFESVDPFPIERIKPLRDRAHEGRVNPKGIPCLYMATDPDTAMMEVRPWAGSVLTLAQLILLRDITVVDCTIETHFELPAPSQQQLESNNWYVLNEAFSYPVTRNDDVADYAPTQYLADVFRNKGYDGILYKSSFGDGKNLALFDINAAAVASRCLHKVKKFLLEFRQLSKPVYEHEYETHLQESQRLTDEE
jgi:RES domain-containing protein